MIALLGSSVCTVILLCTIAGILVVRWLLLLGWLHLSAKRRDTGKLVVFGQNQSKALLLAATILLLLVTGLVSGLAGIEVGWFGGQVNAGISGTPLFRVHLGEPSACGVAR